MPSVFSLERLAASTRLYALRSGLCSLFGLKPPTPLTRPIIGLRAWRLALSIRPHPVDSIPAMCDLGWVLANLDVAEAHLASVRIQSPWPRLARLEARCHVRQNHRAPERHCTCGIYATPSSRAREFIGVEQFPNVWLETEESFAKAFRVNLLVFGHVALWGRVVEHERGWRAEFAYPSSLFVPHPALIPHVKDYGVPVFTFAEGRDMLWK